MVSRAVGEPQTLPLFKVHCMVGLRCKLGGEGSWECWERSEVRAHDPLQPSQEDSVGRQGGSWIPTGAHPEDWRGAKALAASHRAGAQTWRVWRRMGYPARTDFLGLKGQEWGSLKTKESTR